MNGKVVAVLVAKGQPIVMGPPLVIVEVMKMRHELTAGCNGIVQHITVEPEEQVANR